MTHEFDSPKLKGLIQMWTEYEPWCTQIEDFVLFGGDVKVTGICSEEKTQTLA
jgi:hypothetical protein